VSAGEGPVVEEVAFDVLAGNPTEQELAVVVSVLSSLPSVQPEQPNPPSYGSNREGMMRRTIHPGPGAWRASAFPYQQ
jgi:hypothetical protein